MAAMKNLALMGGTMMLVRRLDQESAEVILYTRAAFALYLAICLLLNLLMHVRVVAAADRTPLVVPPPPPSPFAPPPDPAAPPPPPQETRTTVLAYDLGMLEAARKSWLMNAVVLTLIHAKTGAVNPLIMSSVMGLVKLVDEPLFRLHVLRAPATGALKRPFKPEPNPLATLMQGMAPKEEEEGEGEGAGVGAGGGDGAVGYAGRINGSGGGSAVRRRGGAGVVSGPVKVEELHSDGEEEEEELGPQPLAADKDRDDDDDFCDEPEAKKSK